MTPENQEEYKKWINLWYSKDIAGLNKHIDNLHNDINRWLGYLVDKNYNTDGYANMVLELTQKLVIAIVYKKENY